MMQPAAAPPPNVRLVMLKRKVKYCQDLFSIVKSRFDLENKKNTKFKILKIFN